MRSAQLFEADRGRVGRERVPRGLAARLGEASDERNPAQEGPDHRGPRRGGRPPAWNHDDRTGAFPKQDANPTQLPRPAQADSPGPPRQNFWIKITENGTREVHNEADGSDHGDGISNDDESGLWQYQDPSGRTIGDYSADKLLLWATKGFFPSGLQVRQVGERHWSALSDVVSKLRKQAAAGGGAAPAEVAQPPAPRPPQPPPARPQPAARRRELADQQDAWAADQNHPAAALMAAEPIARPRLDRFDRDGDTRNAGGRGRDAMPPRNAAGRAPAAQRPPAKQADWEEDPAEGAIWAPGGQQETGAQASPAQPQPAAPQGHIPHKAAAKKLFTAEAAMGSEEPVWRYIDPQGNMQGPFPADRMVQWYNAGFLLNPTLQMCGHERRVSAPALPPPECYKPIKELLKAVKEGQPFRPVTVQQIQEILAAVPSVGSLATAKADSTEELHPSRDHTAVLGSAASVPDGPISPALEDALALGLVSLTLSAGPDGLINVNIGPS
ncbi:hypothetical protein WJX84_009031 [Apatococcus fuscideae]|uniref:GYF domain-containing protein n=1 Tax=Apatococcus fuscideae TaxID=2026836 RepID=A0AAW1SQB4_9CHLO